MNEPGSSFPFRMATVTPEPTMRPAWAGNQRMTGVAPMAPLQPVATVSPVAGMPFLYLFLFLLLGRFCDIYLTGLHIPLVLSLITLLSAIASGRLRFAFATSTFRAMLGLTLWIIIGTPFSMWRGGSVEVLSDWLKSFISFVVILAMVDTVEKTARVLQVVAAASLCTALLTLVAGDQLAGRLMLRQGLYSGPNELATACVTGLIAWCFVMGYTRIGLLARIAMIPFALFVATIIPRTGSRAALVTTMVVLLFFLVRFALATRIVVLLLGAGGLFLLVFSLPSEIRMRYTSMFWETEATNRSEMLQMEYAQGSSDERWRLFVDSLWITAQHPLFGVGAGNFGVARNGMQIAQGARRGSYQGTHNTYTQISSELGLPGFIFFVASLLFCWRNIRLVIRVYKPLKDPHSKLMFHTANTLWLMLVAYIVVFCFEYIGYSPFYLVVCALITSFSHAAMNDYARAQAIQNQSRTQPA